MNFTAQETTLKLGNNKPTNFESDYRSNYLEHPIKKQEKDYNRLEELKAKLRQTNFELDQLGNAPQNHQSMYKEDYREKHVNLPQKSMESQQDHQNLQKTNFMLGSLGSQEQKQIYMSETAKNFVAPEKDNSLMYQNLPNPNLESL